jgi:hypothetical protein
MNLGDVAICYGNNITEFNLPLPFLATRDGAIKVITKFKDSIRILNEESYLIGEAIHIDARNLNENYEYELILMQDNGVMYSSGAPNNYNGVRFRTVIQSAGV